MLLPSEPLGLVRIGTSEELADASTRSHLADGRCVGWYGHANVVIDAELFDQPVPTALARRYGVDAFWERWTRAECAAKSAGVPIVRWLQRHGLGGPGDEAAWTGVIDGVVLSVMARADPTDRSGS